MYLITLYVIPWVVFLFLQNWPSYLKAVKRPTVSTTRMFLTMTGTAKAMMTMMMMMGTAMIMLTMMMMTGTVIKMMTLMMMTMLRTLVAPASNSGLEAKRSSQIKRNGVAFSNLTPFLN